MNPEKRLRIECLITAVALSLATACQIDKPGGDVNEQGSETGQETTVVDQSAFPPHPVLDRPLPSSVRSPGYEANETGIALASSGLWGPAESQFWRAITADPRLPEAYFNLGLVLAVLGDEERASAAFSKAAELAPGDSRIIDSPAVKQHRGA